jgi:hypothetical protein
LFSYSHIASISRISTCFAALPSDGVPNSPLSLTVQVERLLAPPTPRAVAQHRQQQEKALPLRAMRAVIDTPDVEHGPPPGRREIKDCCVFCFMGLLAVGSRVVK